MERRGSEKEATLLDKLKEHEKQTTATHEIVNAIYFYLFVYLFIYFMFYIRIYIYIYMYM